MDEKNQKSEMEFDYSTISRFMQEHGKFCRWKLEMKSGKQKRHTLQNAVSYAVFLKD